MIASPALSPNQFVVIAAALLVAVLAGSAGGGAPASGLTDGIQVHGHWTLDILNPDGSEAARHEFDNALASVGDEALALLLMNQYSSDSWAVYAGERGFLGGDLQPVYGVSPCTTPFPPPSGSYGGGFGLPSVNLVVHGSPLFMPEGCVLDSFGGLLYTPDGPLTVSVPAPGTGQLQGTFTATQDGTIDTVESWVALAEGSLGENIDMYQFTRKEMTPVSVTTGQTVTITVEFTFS